jgi:cytochrome c oxidase accessory protein FixG
VLAHLAAAMFVTPRALMTMIEEGPRQSMEAFAWVASLSVLIYLDASWFREQLCLIVCPYGRLQSLLLDPHSLVVGYDVRRGEPRGKASQPGAGDCVDCGRCVAVCPTGIDIRHGLQVDCVACTACIDACDEIMDRLARPRGLIRYASQATLEHHPARPFRPRVLIYAGLALASLCVLLWAVFSHDDFQARLSHLPGAPYAIDNDRLSNAFEVVVVNKSAEAATFELSSVDRAGVEVVVPMHEIRLEALATARIPLFVTMSRARFGGSFPVTVAVERVGGTEPKTVKALFLGPAD